MTTRENFFRQYMSPAGDVIPYNTERVRRGGKPIKANGISFREWVANRQAAGKPTQAVTTAINRKRHK